MKKHIQPSSFLFFFLLYLLIPKLLGRVCKYSSQLPQLEIDFLFKQKKMKPCLFPTPALSEFHILFKIFLCAVFAVAALSKGLWMRALCVASTRTGTVLWHCNAK